MRKQWDTYSVSSSKSIQWRACYFSANLQPCSSLRLDVKSTDCSWAKDALVLQAFMWLILCLKSGVTAVNQQTSELLPRSSFLAGQKKERNVMHHLRLKTDLVVLGIWAIPSQPTAELARFTQRTASIRQQTLQLDATQWQSTFPLMGNNYTLSGFFSDFWWDSFTEEIAT